MVQPGNGTNRDVWAMTVFDDGAGPTLFLGGWFSSVGSGDGFPNLAASNIVKWTGSSWLAVRTGMNADVRALAVFDDGTGPALYAGGEFNSADGNSARHIAKWNGFQWSALGSNVGGGGVDDDVHALAAFHNGTGPALYVGGAFTSAEGSPAERIAQWDGASWSALGAGMNDTVYALKVLDLGDGNGSSLFAGGAFTTAGSLSSDRIARYSCPNLDLALSFSESVEPVVAGTGAGNLTHTLTVSNTGSTNATGLALSLATTSTAGVSVDSVVPSQGSFVADAWTIGTLAGGTQATLTVTLTVGPSAARLAVVDTTASITGLNESDANPANDTAGVSTGIETSADISLTKDDVVDPVEIGSDVTYTLVVSNAGPSDAQGVVVTESLPADVTLVSTSGCVEDPMGAPTCTVGTIAGGASGQVTLVARVEPTSGPMLINDAGVSGLTSDPNPGNNNASESTGTVGDIPPTVTQVDSVAGTGDGELRICESTRVAIHALQVSFSEPVRDPVGNSDPIDVTNPSAYLLLEAGPDADFSTNACGGVLGDDVAVAILSVTYDASTRTAEIDLGQPLDDGLYRLRVCAEAVQDLTGKPLDGNADTTGGDDFATFWRVDQANRFVNGSFDCTLDPWTTVSVLPEEITFSSVDVDGSSFSGSAWARNLSGSEDFFLGQCVEPVGLLEMSIRLSMPVGGGLEVSWMCEGFADTGCTGVSLGIAGGTVIQGDTASAWQTLGGAFTSPAGAVSALCSYHLFAPGGVTFDAFLDNASTPVVIFADGFESGNTSAWSP